MRLVNDDKTGFTDMLGVLFLMLVLIWAFGSAVMLSVSHVLDKGAWQCSQLTNGECSRYERK